MAKENDSAPQAGQTRSGSGISIVQLIIPLLNLVALSAACGMAYYWKFVFKRPEITETTERARLAQKHAEPKPSPTPALIKFPQVTINIESNPDKPRPAENTVKQLQGKLHYATVEFFIEIRDITQKETIEAIRPLISDKLIQMVGQKRFHDLTHVQGRYVLQSQIIEFINQTIIKNSSIPHPEPIVKNFYFTQFLVQ